MSIKSFLCKLLGCTHPVVPVTGGPEIVCVLVPNTDVTWLQGASFETYITGPLQEFVSQHWAPQWGLPCTLSAGPSIPQGKWGMVFSDNADVANALGYHDITSGGLPLGKVFVRTTLNDGQDVSVTASHELVEILADPSINLCASHVTQNDDTIYAYETADAVEENDFVVGGFKMTDFVLRTYFEDFHPSGTKRDYLGVLPGKQAFEIASGGYMAVFRNGQWTQIFANAQKAMRFAQEDRRDHRTELRAKAGLQRSVI